MITVTAYGLGFRVIFENKPLDEVKGMAYGVREDAESGKRIGLVPNQCTSKDSEKVLYWEIHS